MSNISGYICPDCAGTKKDCKLCKGKGKVRSSKLRERGMGRSKSMFRDIDTEGKVLSDLHRKGEG